ncbi:MAG: SPOR domain-containing protein [Blastomonas sp.]
MRTSRFFRQALFVAAIGAVSAPALADVKAGVDAWERGDYATAIQEWRAPAIEGDPDAQFNMGQAYKLGRGVPMDLNIAQDWFRRAADQGHMQASDNYGLILFQNNRREDAMPYIEASAKRGEPRAQYVLGTALFNGDMMNKDWVRAYALMTRASAQGLPQASKSLSTMDQYIPMQQRQEGTLLAATLEREAADERRRLASGYTPAPAPVPTRATSGTIQTTQLPPSAPASGAGWSTDAAANAGADYANRPPVFVPTPVAAANPAPASTPAPVRSGAWRIQLGAFSVRDRASSLWTSLEARHSQLAGLQPYLVGAGKLTKLQAGPFASQADAKRMCDQIATAQQPCIAVKP